MCQVFYHCATIGTFKYYIMAQVYVNNKPEKSYSKWHNSTYYAECRYAECRYVECRYNECHYAECR
jgi:hypothetical protein